MPDSSLSRRRFVSALGGAAAARAAAKRPNIILIMADDMGYSDAGCYGGEIRTPNIDSLARGGIRFTQFYNAAKCCPTRASLLTGLYNHQAGVGNMVENMGRASYQGYLNDRSVTIAEALRDAGYHTRMSGKWHVGEKRPHWPLDRGFEHYAGLISGSSSFFRLSEDRPLVIGNEIHRPPDDSFYLTDLFTDWAVKHIEEASRRPQPYFLYVAYTAPHWPLHALEEDIARYRGKYLKGWDVLRRERHERQLEMGLVEKRWPLSPRDPEAPAWDGAGDKQGWDLKMAVYAAQIDRMDQGVGRILRKLRDTGGEDNTLVLFLSDNGGCSVHVDRGKQGVPPGPAGSFLSYGLPWANASNTPFRLYKSTIHEGGISTPLIARWPARIRKTGGLTSQPGHVMDILPTCLDAAGARYPASFRGRGVLSLEGRSLMPVIEGGRREPHASIGWEHQGARGIRQGPWKLVAPNGGPWELYDIEADRTECHDLAAKDPERLERMIAAYHEWANRCGVVPWEHLRNGGKKKKA
jgi:arylsulfatase